MDHHIGTAIGTVTADPLVVVTPSMRDPIALESSYLSPTTVSYVRLAHIQTSEIERRQDMTRMLILATFSLAATTLPLPKLRTDLCKAQCKGQSKAPQWLARAWCRVPVKPVRVLRRDLPA